MYKYLSYVSRQTHALSEEAIENMLQTCRRNNTASGITGILVYINGTFTQYIEGPEEKIDTLFEKIKRDRRHTQVIELFSGHSDERFYGNWSMAYKSLRPEEAENITGYRPFVSDDYLSSPGKSIESHPAISLMTSFVKDLRVA
ncbi:BLUF domain-containing protein [Croceiramulus getboli]|nr:BLUF domain-containing protein [Flavobacteriaceae bacterium YJPT1-3]